MESKMKYRVIFYCICISYLLGYKRVLSTDFQDDQKSKNHHSIFHSCNNFSSKFIQVLTSNQNEDNILVSSLSAYVILSVLFHGADKVTKEQLKSGLHLSDSELLQYGLKQLLNSFSDVKEAELEIANAMFICNKFSLKQEFLSKSKNVHETTIESIDPQDSFASAEKVNSWIKDKTKGKISDVISSSDIDEYTKLILVNALYFKSAWLRPFDSQSTEKKKFYSINGVETHIPTMYKTIQVPHGDIPSLDASFIKLKYKTEDFEMIIILPNQKTGLYDLERNFEWNLISKATYSTKEVELFLPKFKLEATVDLKQPLQKLGISSIFEQTANFDFMAKEPVYVGKMIQKLFVEVDEKGSEAAAATVAEIRSRRMIVDTDYFKVDHPFMFIINHKPSNVPLFIGSIRKLGEVKDEL